MRELIIICAIVRALNPKLIVEIGTCEGRTTINMALHSPEDAQLITLDLPPDSPPQGQKGAIEGGLDYRQMGIPKPGLLFENHPLKRKIKLVLADSTKFDWTPYEGLVDLVFVDGAHDYESVAKDSENALSITKEGSVILWHDYGVVEGVTAALNKLSERYPIKHIDGTSIAC
ncbi:MAG: class I SAM-dependent methyltransferase, partial [Armatimonadetes bacterium]|nr:class I SAM-dependent methyltransferase [Armatimonadota bacterium]